MAVKSTDQPTLYPSLELQQPSAPNLYDNLPDSQVEDWNAALSATNAVSATAHTFRLHKINEIIKILETERKSL
jgi:hypothetical protein